MTREMDGIISSACARVIWNGANVCISGKLRKAWGVVIHCSFVSGHHIYLYMLGDVLLWNRDTCFWGKGEMG
jgi:hypothetical protein